MYRVTAYGTALLAAWLGMNALEARAADASEPSDISTAPAGGSTTLLFSGADLWRKGGSMYGGLVWSPGGLANDGFTFKMLLSGGLYRYRSGNSEIPTDYGLAGFMPGWRFRGNGFEITAYAGLDLQQHRPRPDDPANDLRRFHAGLRTGVDIWYEPAPGMMTTGSLWVSTIGGSYWLRGAAGWRLFERAWVGPEAGAQGNSIYQQVRFGAHVTGLRTGAFEWTIGSGIVLDSEHRTSPYVHIDALTRM